MFYSYILTNPNQDVFFTAHCDDLIRRIYEHKVGRQLGRATDYTIDQLVWYEAHPTRAEAAARAAEIKNWPHDWRLSLLQKSNPSFEDLSQSLTDKGQTANRLTEKRLMKTVPICANLAAPFEPVFALAS